ARAAVITLDDLGEGWSLFREEANDEFAALAAVYWALYERENWQTSPVSDDPFLVLSGAAAAGAFVAPLLFAAVGVRFISDFSRAFQPGMETRWLWLRARRSGLTLRGM